MADNRNLIDALWRDFQNNVIPPQAGKMQVRDMRRCFFAGATAMLNAILPLAEDDVSEEYAESVMEDLAEEVDRFAQSVGKPEEDATLILGKYHA